MSRKTLFITLGICIVVITAAFLAGKAYASTGCFTDTNGNWAEVYICWLKDNGISNGFGDGTYHPDENVTRAQMAKFLSLQAEVPPSSGEILVQVGLTDWYLDDAFPDAFIRKTHHSVDFGKPGGGMSEMDASPAIPLALYGHNLALKGMELCYYVVAAHGSLTSVQLYVFSIPTFSGITIVGEAVDGTIRKDEACRIYAFSAPVTLDFDSQIIIRLYASNISGIPTSTVVSVSRTTLYLQPTTLSTNLSP